ncbi:hypothetical protein CKAH01_03682 [Colletotrichum kahawae]|uniref:DUF6546 domain-containing protein n=1 Tax=Colletotrichum kahawae TaxID=34407 RepID=A0AAD9YRK1_COLKA|nr:hypothetical protein CKAH01_03682 [Colletotrichum kahawae]
MKLRSRTTYSPDDINHIFPWASLPAEIRLMILEQVEVGNKGHKLSNWASVSREWQAFFEPQLFQNLNLQFPGSDVDDLNSYVHGYRRDLVKKISLHVRTQEYDNIDKFDERETQDTIKANNELFSQALERLFVSLSTWSNGSPTGGIKLALSACSPSDLGHPWNHRTGKSQHEWRRICSLGSRLRLLGNLLDTSSGALKLPRVSIVNMFFVTRYTYRSLSRALLAKVLRSLCRLEVIRYEPWHAITRNGQSPRDDAMITLFESASESATVDIVDIWEVQSSLHQNPPFSRFCNDHLVSKAVNASYRLQYLNLWHAVDARDFFHHASRDVPANSSEPPDGLRTWPALEYLGLSTYIEDLVSSPSALERLLLQASQAALRMPLLRVMEIWAPGNGKGFIFRYHFREGSPFLTVIATWQLTLSKEALRSWKQVAAGCTERELTCDVKLMGSGTTMSYLRHPLGWN